MSAAARIDLEYEAAFDWVAFCPLRDSNAGALTKYFGRRRGEDLPDNPSEDVGEAVKLRGIECRQHDTPPFVARVQRDLIATFDRTRDADGHGSERVRLAHEHVEDYDAGWYREHCIRAAVGVVSPLDIQESEIKTRLAKRQIPLIQSF